LQINRRAVLTQHRHPGKPEGVRPGARDPELDQERMEHALADIARGAGRPVARFEDAQATGLSEVFT
jgi:hypothetical protein